MTEITKHFLASEIENTAPQSAYFHVIPVPYEKSTSYGHGTYRGPQAILEASNQLELFDGFSVPADLGIYTHPSVNCDGLPEEVIARIDKVATIALHSQAIPVVLGGEHTVSYGVLQALKRECGQFGILHIDAHADLRDSLEGTHWSHACVMRRAIASLELPLAQFGTRAYCLEEKDAREQYNVIAYDAHLFASNSLPKKLLPDDFPLNVYLSFDVDGLDPSIIPSTGTPVPGGLYWYQALNLIKTLLDGRHLIGFDVVELAPNENSRRSDFAAASLVYQIMGIVQRKFL